MKSRLYTSESDRRQHDRPTARVITQQYSSAIFHSRKTDIGASFRNVVSEFLKIFLKIQEVLKCVILNFGRLNRWVGLWHVWETE